MNGLSELVESAVDLDFGFLDRFLSGINRLREQVATALDAVGIAAVVEFNSFRLQKAAEVSEEFVFLDGLHRSIHVAGTLPYGAASAIIRSRSVYSLARPGHDSTPSGPQLEPGERLHERCAVRVPITLR